MYYNVWIRTMWCGNEDEFPAISVHRMIKMCLLSYSSHNQHSSHDSISILRLSIISPIFGNFPKVYNCPGYR